MVLGTSTPSKVTPYLIYLVFIVTLGPLQFGYHLVRQIIALKPTFIEDVLIRFETTRLSSMPPKLS
jgi:hypothetical protein